MLRPLGTRLESIVHQLRPGLPLWDIGCDHGLVGLRAWQIGHCRQVNFVDQSTLAIHELQLKAKQLFGPTSSKAFKFWCIDATKWTEPVFGNIVIAGMGPHTMNRILDALYPHLKEPFRLILGPHGAPHILREHLRDLGLQLQNEWVIKEKEHYREFMSVEAQGALIAPFGSLLWQNPDPVTAQYRDHLLELYRKWSPQNPTYAWELTQLSLALRHSNFDSSH